MHTPLRHRSNLAIAVLCALPLLAGCRVTMPAGTMQADLPVDSSAELVAAISNMPFVTAEAAYRATYTLSTAEVFDGDFDELGTKLAAEGMIDARWNLTADTYVNRAEVGYMICRACKIDTGLTWRLAGCGRYAWRELRYRGICRGGGEMNLVSGGEFLGILQHAGQYLQDRLPAADRAELGTPPGGP